MEAKQQTELRKGNFKHFSSVDHRTINVGKISVDFTENKSIISSIEHFCFVSDIPFSSSKWHQGM